MTALHGDRPHKCYERLINYTDDPGTIDTLQFLMTREVTHMKAFSAALESLEKSPFSIGRLAVTPGIVDEFFNASTGDGDEGDTDMHGPWQSSFGLHPVESQMNGGKGLEAFQSARVETRHFYIFSESLMQPPPPTRKVTKENGEVFYYVSPGVGTPSLEFLGGGLFLEVKSGANMIRPGFLEFSREYWSVDLSRKLQSPTELESLFKTLSRAVKAHSSRIKPGKSVFWLGENARVEVESGARLVLNDSWSPEPARPKSSRLSPAKLGT